MSAKNTSLDGDAMLNKLTEHLREPPALPTVPVYALPDQPYLEATVMPLLLRGLEEVSKARPVDPLAFLAAYLLNNNPQRCAHPLLGEDARRIPLQEIAQRAAEITSRTSRANTSQVKM
ncbi:Dpy-30 motif [Trypanosoma melophagium]|uniref:Dpy-30 motif n=1 Tax=Trypanosoma melophagium TaxID=715481 RepID=UPI00351AA296|nr:Dpy-30 motif [Trypanosoma melophagium]